VETYLADLRRRADAGEVSAATPRRFSSALGHYLAYTCQPTVSVGYPAASKADRAFAMGFAAYLQGLQVSPNGHKNTQHRRMTGQRFVLNVVRGMYEWASDPDRGACMPAGFVSPFRTKSLQPKVAATPMVGEPDVTVTMAASFLQACDPYQFRLFVPMILLGLRAAEPLMLFHEKLSREWLDVVCIPELDYRTKGVRDKRLPLVPGLADHLRGGGGRGLLFVRRSIAEGRERAPLRDASFDTLVEEHRRRCAKANATSASERATIRDRLLHDAGAMTYKMIQGEFTNIASQLGWPKQATLKDFRHLFATSMANGGVPEHERQYLMGQSPGKAVILQYTHVNRLREHYLDALRREMGPVLEVLDRPRAVPENTLAA
jgi:integrase